MLGLAKGMLADGEVSSAEASLLQEWARLHPDVVTCWPGNILRTRLERIFADGVVSTDERGDLAELLQQLTGGHAGILAGDTAASALPLDTPPPDVVFPRRTFVFTGKFAFGPRRTCEAAVLALGAHTKSSVTRDTHYLVIGTFGSRDWIHTSHGRKIEEAVALRSGGGSIAILSEDHWAAALS
jgi:NAD-dependent DNA ligase